MYIHIYFILILCWTEATRISLVNKFVEICRYLLLQVVHLLQSLYKNLVMVGPHFHIYHMHIKENKEKKYKIMFILVHAHYFFH